ncbi:MAG: hypothetical protein MJE77_24760 [Proteobacteria bacterium]|nr:hypothetical protein [Pseudomonadota bacterium]
MTKNSVHVVVLISHLEQGPAAAAIGEHEALGGCERAALQLALRLRDQLHGTLTALALGREALQRPILDAALRAGCNRAVCLDQPGKTDLNWANINDLSAARVISAALSRIECHLLLCADHWQDELRSAIGAAVAELQGIPHLTGVVDAVPDGPHSVIAKHRGGGQVHRFRCSLPVTLCVLASEPGEPGEPARDPAADPTGAVTRASRPETQPPGLPHPAEIERLSPTDLGIELEDLNHHQGDLIRPARPAHKAAVMASAADLIARLVDDHLLR